jgi:hypothetical protein
MTYEIGDGPQRDPAQVINTLSIPAQRRNTSYISSHCRKGTDHCARFLRRSS